MTVKFLENLSKNYLELLNDKEDFNVIIEVGESTNIKLFRAHSAILRSRSSYFHSELINASKNSNNIKKIFLKFVSIQQFEIIIRYIYGGLVSLENIDPSFIFDLVLVAYEFFLDELAKHLENHLIKEKSHWLLLHFARIYKSSFQYDKLNDLRNWCNNITTKYPNKIFDSSDFTSFPESSLISLIGRDDDLQIDEVKIWNYIIKWGVAQSPNISSNPRDWSHNDVSTLKSTLKNFLPLIRYSQISDLDIIYNVQPYKQIFDENLWKNIIKRSLSSNQPKNSIILPPRIVLTPIVSPRAVESFSTILNYAHLAEIASWIDKKTVTYSVENIPYDFKLLLRGSKDGFSSAEFWNLCDKQENIIVITKVKGTDEILGGYNPISWDKPEKNHYYKYCNESFIFSLKNNNIQTSILSRVKRSQYAIYCNSNHGPNFGGSSLVLINNFDQDNQCFCYHSIYEKLIRSASTYIQGYSFFSVEDYEIFQIHKKSI